MKRNEFLIRIFTLINTATIAFSSDAFEKKIEIRLDKENYSMEKVKERTQINHICYAHAASDMVDSVRFFYLKDIRYNLRTSPLALSIMHSTQGKDGISYAKSNFFEFGQICASVKTAFKYGIKDFKEIDKIVFDLSVPDKNNLKEHWNNVKLLTPQEQAQTRDIFNDFFEDILENYKKMAKENITYRKMGYGPYLNTWLAILSPKTYSLKIFQKKFPECKREDTKNKFKDRTFKIYSIITEYFTKNSKEKLFPIGLDFCERFLNTGLVGRIGEQTRPTKSTIDCDRHAVTIVGYRVLKNAKGGEVDEVLIKNSRPCSFMHSSFECKDSKVWVPLKELLLSSMSIHYFPKS